MKQNNTLFIITIVAIFIIINTPGNFFGSFWSSLDELPDGYIYCYQEKTNAATSGDGNCGLNYGGSYTSSGSAWTSGGTNVYDGSWSSSDKVASSSSTVESVIEVIYKVPTGASTELSKLKIKTESHGTEYGDIYPICWESNNILRFKISSKKSSSGQLQLLIYCGDNRDTSANRLFSTTQNNIVYEEAMEWAIGSTSTCNNVADTSSDCVISNTELLSYINLWKAGTATRDNLGIAINIWINGGY